MRFEKLNLIAYGKFEGAELDFTKGNQGLHLIVGSNEAGKSTALSAIIDFLFGFPKSTGYSFQFDTRDLRIGATIRNAAGEVRSFIRRKGNQATLRQADDAGVAEEAWLQACLGHVSRSVFQHQFGMGYQELVSGGQEVIQGKGELAELLFAAGAGLRDLRTMRKKLDAEAEELYLKSGKKPKINENLRLYKEQVKGVPHSSLSVREHVSTEQKRIQQIQLADELRQKHLRLSSELESLKRIQQGFKPVNRRTLLQQKYLELKDVPDLDEQFSKRRAHAEKARIESQVRLENIRLGLANAQERLARVKRKPNWIEEAPTITGLADQIRVIETALVDQKSLQKRVKDLEAAIIRSLGALGESTDIHAIESLRPNVHLQHEVARLAAQRVALAEKRQSSRDELITISQEHKSLQQKLADSSEPPEPKPLKLVLAKLGAIGQLCGKARDIENEFERAVKNSSLAVKRLPGWQGTWEDTLGALFPLDADVEQSERQRQKTEQSKLQIEHDIEQNHRQCHDLEEEIRNLKEERQIPTLEALAQARRARDELWSQLSDALTKVTVENRDSLHSGLLAELQNAIRRCDDIGDRLRAQAEDVARLADRMKLHDRLVQQQSSLQNRLQETKFQLSQFDSQYETLWKELPLSSRPKPGTGIEWLSKAQHAMLTAETAFTARDKVEQVRREVEEAKRAIIKAMEACGSRVDTTHDLDQLLMEANERFDELQQSRQTWMQQQRDLKQLDKVLTSVRELHENAESQWSDWQGQWQTITARLQLPKDILPEEVQVRFTSLNQLFETYATYTEQHRRIHGIQDNFDRFSEQVRRLADRLEVESREDPIRTMRSIAQILGEAIEQENQWNAATRKIEELQGELAKATIGEQTALAEMQQLCREAKCEDPSDLLNIEQRSRERREILRELKTIDEVLGELSVHQSLESFLQRVRETDADDLSHRILSLTADHQTLLEQEQKMREEIAVLSDRLTQLDFTSAAAACAEAADALRSQLVQDIRRYARLRMAEAVLGTLMEQYREKNEGPVLKLAGDYLSRLSLGSLVGLTTELDERGNPILYGVRPNNRTLAVAGMSEGLADQLYLALRLASLRLHLSQHAALPLICDDLLIKFDDQRSQATLEVLAELSDHTQIIFFTHHRHLVEIAQSVAASHKLYVQELPA